MEAEPITLGVGEMIACFMCNQYSWLGVISDQLSYMYHMNSEHAYMYIVYM